MNVLKVEVFVQCDKVFAFQIGYKKKMKIAMRMRNRKSKHLSVRWVPDVVVGGWHNEVKVAGGGEAKHRRSADRTCAPFII